MKIPVVSHSQCAVGKQSNTIALLYVRMRMWFT